MLNMITGIDNLKKLTKHVLCKCNCKLNSRKCDPNEKWNNYKCQCECKKHICEKGNIWNPATCSSKNM